MAEFLIYNKDHWTKTASQAVKDTWTTNQVEKFKSVAEKGDIVEVKEDGHYTGPGRGFDKEAFAVICAPGVSMKDALAYKGSLKENIVIALEPTTRIVRKFRYNMSNLSLNVNQKQTIQRLSDVTITDKVLSNGGTALVC